MKKVREEDFIHEIWTTNLLVDEKVKLSLSLFEIQPTYHVLTTMWLEYETSHCVTAETTEFIFRKYQSSLSNDNGNLTNSMEYSLYFDIFEEPKINRVAWNFFLQNSPSDNYLKIMLVNSGPVPFDLKYELYKVLLPREKFHNDVFRSIRHSCFDNCGKVDKPKAFSILKQLNVSEGIDENNSKMRYQKYTEVTEYLENKNGG